MLVYIRRTSKRIYPILKTDVLQILIVNLRVEFTRLNIQLQSIKILFGNEKDIIKCILVDLFLALS